MICVQTVNLSLIDWNVDWLIDWFLVVCPLQPQHVDLNNTFPSFIIGKVIIKPPSTTPSPLLRFPDSLYSCVKLYYRIFIKLKFNFLSFQFEFALVFSFCDELDKFKAWIEYIVCLCRVNIELWNLSKAFTKSAKFQLQFLRQ